MFSEIDPAVIDAGLASGELSEFYETVRSNGFRINAETRKWFSKLTLCTDRTDGLTSPPIFYVGPESSQKVLFGSGWTTQLGTENRTPDPQLEINSATGYVKAIQDGVFYGYARTPVTFEGATIDVAFERLIVSLKTPADTGKQIIAYFGVIQDIENRMII